MPNTTQVISQHSWSVSFLVALPLIKAINNILQTQKYFHFVNVEHQPLYPKYWNQYLESSISAYPINYQIESPIHTPVAHHEPNTQPEPKTQTEVHPSQEPPDLLFPNDAEPTNYNDLLTYSGRKRNQREILQQIPFEQVQELDPSSRSESVAKGNSNLEYYHKSANDDLNQTIVVRKGVRSCTKHPIYNFVHIRD